MIIVLSSSVRYGRVSVPRGDEAPREQFGYSATGFSPIWDGRECRQFQVGLRFVNSPEGTVDGVQADHGSDAEHTSENKGQREDELGAWLAGRSGD